MWSFYYLLERKWHEKFQIWKILNFIHVHLGPQWKIVNYVLQEELMGAKCLYSGRNKWNKGNHFDFMRNDVLQNYLFQFCKCLADNFDNIKLQDASKVLIFRPPNSYILHCHDKCGLFTIYLKGNDMKNSIFGKS